VGFILLETKEQLSLLEKWHLRMSKVVCFIFPKVFGTSQNMLVNFHGKLCLRTFFVSIKNKYLDLIVCFFSVSTINQIYFEIVFLT